MWDNHYMILFSLNREIEMIKDPSFQIFNYLKKRGGFWKCNYF